MAVMGSFGLVLYLIRILVGKPVFLIDVCVVCGSPAAPREHRLNLKQSSADSFQILSVFFQTVAMTLLFKVLH
jgi:hypothetical protein